MSHINQMKQILAEKEANHEKLLAVRDRNRKRHEKSESIMSNRLQKSAEEIAILKHLTCDPGTEKRLKFNIFKRRKNAS